MRTHAAWLAVLLGSIAALTSCGSTSWNRVGVRTSYSTAWLGADRPLVAGPQWGVAEIGAQGEVVRTWCAASDEVLSIASSPRDDDTLFVACLRDHVVSANDNQSAEVYRLDLSSGELFRLTHDELHDELLCATHAGDALVASIAPSPPSLLMSVWNPIGVRTVRADGAGARVLYGSKQEFVSATREAPDRIVLEPRGFGLDQIVIDANGTASSRPRTCSSRAADRGLWVEWVKPPPASQRGLLRIHVEASDGSAARCIYEGADNFLVESATLSPDGAHASFVRNDGSSDYELWLVDLLHTTVVRVPLPLRAR